MLARVNPAEAGLLRGVREAVEGTDDPGKHFRSDAQMERLVAEQGAQHERAAGADRGVCAGGRRIRGGFSCLREAGWIRRRGGGAVRSRGSDTRHRAPQNLRGLWVVKNE